MQDHRTREELESTVRDELAQLGLIPSRVEVKVSDRTKWHIEIEVGKRHFSMGSIYRDGFFCGELIQEHEVNFVAHTPTDEPIFGPEDSLRRQALQLVRYAIDHPDFRRMTRPVI